MRKAIVVATNFFFVQFALSNGHFFWGNIAQLALYMCIYIYIYRERERE